MNQNEFTNYISPKLQIQIAQGMDASLGENINDTFMTADESGNNTQFFSVLESSSATILDNITYDNLAVDEHEFTFTDAGQVIEAETSQKQEIYDENVGGENMADQELIIFKSPHSMRLFGLQTTHDEDGNLQKYQYEVIQNEDGQYESIPGTIHLVPYETDPATVIHQMEAQLEQAGNLIDNVINNNDDIQSITQGAQQFVKNEPLAVDDVYITGMDVEEDIQQATFKNQQAMDALCMNLQETEEHIDAVHEVQDSEVEEEERETSPIPVKQGILESALKGIYSPVKSENAGDLVYIHESDEQVPALHDIVEGEDVEVIEEEQPVIHLQDIQNASGHRTVALYPIKESMLKTTQKLLTTIEIPGSRQRPKYVLSSVGTITAPLKSLNSLKRPHGTLISNAVVSPQKENLEVAKRGISIIKRNSVRRTLNKCFEGPELEEGDGFLVSATSSEANRFEWDKKKQPPWNVNKMISQTKIIEAPVRQERLPRKQKIKPLERLGEELEFQHVTVTASGVIETKVDGVVKARKMLEPRECIQLSDNEDEYARKCRKRNAKKKQIEIVISDDEYETFSATKEDPKDTPNPPDAADSDAEVLNKEEEKDGEDKVVDTVKDVNECLKCSKSFPSIGSLKTHMQSHALEEASSEAAVDEIDKGRSVKHACSICSETFLNAFLRNKHEQLHKTRTKIECIVCKRLYKNVMQLNAHKKIHKPDTASKTLPAEKVAEKRCLRSGTKLSENIESKPPKSVQNTTKEMETIEKPVLSVKSSKSKNRLSSSIKRRSVAQPSSRKSLMPPLAVRKSFSANVTRRTLLPSKNTALNSSDVGVRTRASVTPITSFSSLPPPNISRPSSSKIFKCLTCKCIFLDKLALDLHIIKSCVKSPRRPLKPTQGAKIETPYKTRSKSSSTPVLEKLAVKTNELHTSKSDHCLNVTVEANTTMQKAQSAKETPSSRRRIATNAGLSVIPRMYRPLMNFRSTMRDDSDDDDTGRDAKADSHISTAPSDKDKNEKKKI